MGIHVWGPGVPIFPGKWGPRSPFPGTSGCRRFTYNTKKSAKIVIEHFVIARSCTSSNIRSWYTPSHPVLGERGRAISVLGGEDRITVFFSKTPN